LTTVFDFILEIVAVFVGVFAAFELDNYREASAENKERLRLLALIRREVHANEQVLTSMTRIETDDPVSVESSRSIRNIWEGITGKLVILRNDELLEATTLLYFQLANLDRLLDLYREYAGAYLYASPNERMRMEPRLKDQRTHYVTFINGYVLPQISLVLRFTDAELGHSKPAHVPKSNAKPLKTGVP